MESFYALWKGCIHRRRMYRLREVRRLFVRIRKRSTKERREDDQEISSVEGQGAKKERENGEDERMSLSPLYLIKRRNEQADQEEKEEEDKHRSSVNTTALFPCI